MPTKKDFLKERYHTQQVNKKNETRSPYERDKGRVIHSAAFRRLQGKTQVMGVGEGDFHRTRLTHSLEVAQIGAGILQNLQSRKGSRALSTEVKQMLPDSSLIESACLAHDLGHPPFGHGGEVALNECMLKHGGFEGNGQTLRIITKLEKYQKNQGINPTRRLILAVLKYPIEYSKLQTQKGKPPKCYLDTEHHIVEWAIECFKKED